MNTMQMSSFVIISVRFTFHQTSSLLTPRSPSNLKDTDISNVHLSLDVLLCSKQLMLSSGKAAGKRKADDSDEGAAPPKGRGRAKK